MKFVYLLYIKTKRSGFRVRQVYDNLKAAEKIRNMYNDDFKNRDYPSQAYIEQMQLIEIEVKDE